MALTRRARARLRTRGCAGLRAGRDRALHAACEEARARAAAGPARGQREGSRAVGEEEAVASSSRARLVNGRRLLCQPLRDLLDFLQGVLLLIEILLEQRDDLAVAE